MNTNTSIDLSEDYGTSPDAAVQLEKEARQEDDIGTYVHEFSRPFTWNGRTYERMTFRWDSLTGADHLAAESELMILGKTLVIPEYTGMYLCSMAARACAERQEDGKRVLDAQILKTIPVRDFRTICRQVQGFLLRAGSASEKTGSGSTKRS